MRANNSSGTWSELLWGRNGLRSIALAGGIALHAINVYIVSTVLPSVVSDIGGLEYYAWNMTLFVVTSIVGSALTPKSIDSIGLRNAFLVAIGIFIIGTAVCASAPHMVWMLAGRTSQGLGGGLMLGLSYAATRILFEERLWPKAMALLSSMWGVATLAGPAIGGIFAQLDAWRWSFISVIPLSLGLALLVYTQITSSANNKGSNTSKVPVGQLGLMVIAVLVVSFASLSLSAWVNLFGIVFGVLLTVLIARIDNTSSTRLLPNGAYSLGGGLGNIYACVALLSITMTMELFIPYFLQVIQGFKPIWAGYFMVLISAGWSTGSIISSSRSGTSADLLMRIGSIICSLAVAILALVQPLHIPSILVLISTSIGLLLFFVGIGIGITWPHLLTEVFRTAPKGQENIASSAIITVQLYALAFGAALGGMVTNASGFVDPGGFEGTRSASVALLLTLSVAPAISAVMVQAVVGRRIINRKT